MRIFHKAVSLLFVFALMLSSGAQVFATGNLEQGAGADEVTVLTIVIDTMGLDFKEDVQLDVIKIKYRFFSVMIPQLLAANIHKYAIALDFLIAR